MKEKRGVSIQSSSSVEIKRSQQEQDSNKSSCVVEKKFERTQQNATKRTPDLTLTPPLSNLSPVTKMYFLPYLLDIMLYAWWWWLSLLLCLLNNHIIPTIIFFQFPFLLFFISRVKCLNVICVCDVTYSSSHYHSMLQFKMYEYKYAFMNIIILRRWRQAGIHEHKKHVLFLAWW